jgi:RND family efflux transporter MFP subunit
MKKIIIIALSVIAVAAVAMVLVHNKKEIDANKVQKKDFANGVAVTTEKAFRQDMDKVLKLVGSTAPMRETDAPALSAGNITALSFKNGDRVGAGSVLVKIDDKLKVLAVENAKTQVQKYETDLAKIKNMFDKNAATETQLREIKFAYETAKNQLEQAKKQLENSRVVAPFGGTVTAKFVELGGYINLGSPICHIVDMSSLKITLSVSESDAYQLKVGKKVKILSSVYPSVEYDGEIIFISPQSDKGHNFPIEIKLNNKKNYELKSGSYVNINIDLENTRRPLLIPRQALVGSINDAQIYVVENGAASLRKISVGGEYDKYLEVIDGVKEGEEVITSGQVNLEDKMKVRSTNK